MHRRNDERAKLIVNDVHSRLNPTRVAGVVRPRDVDELRDAVRSAAERGSPLAVCGGRHAMGAQQFATDALLLDTTSMNRAIRLDPQRALLEMEAGADWPA